MSVPQPVPNVVVFGEDVLERMVLAAEKVRDRLRRATAALNAAQIPYAVTGGNAVAAWVSKVDPGAARNTVDVDLMINRADLDSAEKALTNVGFVHRELLGEHMFLDGPDGRPRDAVHILFAGEKARSHYIATALELTVADDHETYKLLALEPLVRMKLTSFRDKDRTHLRDLIDVGLIDHALLTRLPTELAIRLKELFDNPEG